MSKRVKTSQKTLVGDLESDLMKSTKAFDLDCNLSQKNNFKGNKR